MVFIDFEFQLCQVLGRIWPKFVGGLFLGRTGRYDSLSTTPPTFSVNHTKIEEEEEATNIPDEVSTRPKEKAVRRPRGRKSINQPIIQVTDGETEKDEEKNEEEKSKGNKKKTVKRKIETQEEKDKE